MVSPNRIDPHGERHGHAEMHNRLERHYGLPGDHDPGDPLHQSGINTHAGSHRAIETAIFAANPTLTAPALPYDVSPGHAERHDWENRVVGEVLDANDTGVV